MSTTMAAEKANYQAQPKAKLSVVRGRPGSQVDATKRLVAFFPGPIYDLAQLLFFPVNYVIGGLCYLQPKKSVWNESGFDNQELAGSGKSLAEIKESITNMQDVAYNEEDLVRLYDSLPAVSAEIDLIGRTWKGRILRTNASVLDLAEWFLVRPLKFLGINWGKRYRDANKGDALLLRFRDTIYAPVPIWGNVGMTDIAWRGTSTATMNYDHQPWKDYFKLLKNEDGVITLLGVWTHKHIAGGWFTLTLDPGVKI